MARQIKCQDCGVVFETGKGSAKRCIGCRAKAEAAHRRRPRPERLRRWATAITCVDCTVVFYASRSDTQRCVPCRQKRHSRQVAGSERKRMHACLDCGKPVVRRASRCGSCRAKATFFREGNPNWKGGRIVTKQGYIRIKNPDPNGHPRYIGEHILVWEAANGPLPKGQHIHHLNGIRDDNRLENLEAMSRHLHQGLHVGTHFKEQIRTLEARIRELESHF